MSSHALVLTAAALQCLGNELQALTQTEVHQQGPAVNHAHQIKPKAECTYTHHAFSLLWAKIRLGRLSS